MRKFNSILYGAVLLTASNLLICLVSMSFRIYLSGKIGSEGIGLLHLVLSVKTLTVTLGSAGIRSCAAYLSADELGRGREGSIRSVMSGCFRYAIVFSSPVALCLWRFAPMIAQNWIGDAAAVPSLRAYALFLTINCLDGVISGCFISLGRVKETVAVNFVEQGFSMILTFFLLTHGAANTKWACLSVILGECAASLLSFCILFTLYRRGLSSSASSRFPPYRRILSVALPLGLADGLRSGLTELKNLIIPKQLALFSGTVNAMADYGVVCGMVFPLLMFPAALLFSVSELLMPEFSRCSAGGHYARVRYLAKRSLKVSLLFSLCIGGIFFCCGEALGKLLYSNAAVGSYLKLYAPLVPILYIDNVADAICKGLGQQNANARYNTVTAVLELSLLRLLLPRLGLKGFYISYSVTRIVNFYLSFRRLILVSGIRLDIALTFRAIISSSAAVFITTLLPRGEGFPGVILVGGYFLMLLTFFWIVLRVITREDVSQISVFSVHG